MVSLVPDSDFPVINSEKGILHTDAVLTPDEVFKDNVVDFVCTGRANVVPGFSSVTLKNGGTMLKNLAADGPFTSDVFSSARIMKRRRPVRFIGGDYGKRS